MQKIIATLAVVGLNIAMCIAPVYAQSKSVTVWMTCTVPSIIEISAGSQNQSASANRVFPVLSGAASPNDRQSVSLNSSSAVNISTNVGNDYRLDQETTNRSGILSRIYTLTTL